MTLEKFKPPEPLPRWLVLPLGLGIALTVFGFVMPWLYPTKSLWTEAAAKEHAKLSEKAHTAHNAFANAQQNKSPTAKENEAESRYWNEQFKLSKQRLDDAREGGSRYGFWLMIAGGTLTAIGVVASLILRRES